MRSGVKRDLYLSVDSLTDEVSARLVLAGGSGAGVAVDGDDGPGSDAA